MGPVPRRIGHGAPRVAAAHPASRQSGHTSASSAATSGAPAGVGQRAERRTSLRRPRARVTAPPSSTSARSTTVERVQGAARERQRTGTARRAARSPPKAAAGRPARRRPPGRQRATSRSASASRRLEQRARAGRGRPRRRRGAAAARRRATVQSTAAPTRTGHQPATGPAATTASPGLERGRVEGGRPAEPDGVALGRAGPAPGRWRRRCAARPSAPTAEPGQPPTVCTASSPTHRVEQAGRRRRRRAARRCPTRRGARDVGQGTVVTATRPYASACRVGWRHARRPRARRRDGAPGGRHPARRRLLGRSRDDERWVVLGPNGAGKTTLLPGGLGPDPPDRGRRRRCSTRCSARSTSSSCARGSA